MRTIPGVHRVTLKTRKGERYTYEIDLGPGENKLLVPRLGGPAADRGRKVRLVDMP